MAKITGISQDAVRSDYKERKARWVSLISTMTAEVELLIHFTAFKNYHFVNGEGIADQDDIDSINAEFIKNYTVLQNLMAQLDELAAIPDENINTFQANNTQYMYSKSLNIADLNKRYQV
jgi:hypothetical protein